MEKLNFINIINQLLPPFKRQPIMIAFLKVLTTPLQSLNDWISNTYYPDVTRRTKWNAQILLFSKALNDLHNNGSITNKIFIDGGLSDIEHTYFFNQFEEVTVDFYNADELTPVYLMNNVEYESPYDFKVNYPTVLESKVKQIENSVKKYKVAGTKYIMQSY